MHIPRTLRQASLASHDPIEAEMLDDLHQQCDGVTPSPYLIVIPAFNESDSLPYVASRLPKEILGIAPAVVVIDDGSSDDTAAVAKDLGLKVVRSPMNRGQGASLRVGYLAAIKFGYCAVGIVDADGQWDPSDLEAVMAPVIQGRAEIVQGSRSLGETHVGDAVRDLGVKFFAHLISWATHTRLTDTSSGIRAMSVALLEKVRLEQAQYQSSELLISAIFAGGRLLEVPVVMSPRFAGTSKKGHNAKYALAYSKVVLGTFLREVRLERLERRARTRAQIIRAA